MRCKNLFVILALLIPTLLKAQSTTVVISQVYGGGGSASGFYNADYVELHNISSVAQDISGYKIMYGSATGNLGSSAGNTFTFAASGVVIPAGGYYLVATIAGAGVSPLPITPDTIFTLTLSGTNGKVAFGTDAMLANTLYANQPAGSVIDFVGYGTASEFEGAAAPALTPTTALVRNNNGCQETNFNSVDFLATTPAPRNSATTPFLCNSGPGSPTILAGTVTYFGGVTVLTGSPSQTFQIFGTDLTGAPGNISITSPGPDFQVSANNVSFGATAQIPYTSSSLPTTLVYVKFTPQTTGFKSGNISVNGGGISSPVLVAVSGTGTTATPPQKAIVISQIYGAGGNSGAAYNADYLELHNRSASAKSIAGFSVQYGSSTTTGYWSGKAILPNVSIPAGGYYLVQMSVTGTTGASLPTPDHIASPAVSMGQSNGRVALVSDTFLLYGCPTTNNMEDLVGYGTSTCSETLPTPPTDSLNAAFRNNFGCDDTDSNSVNFSILPALPRNSASPVALCATPCTANYWTGAVSTAWNNAGNWSCGTVPDSTTVVYIEAGKPRYPIVTTNASCKTIYTATGATLRVDPNFKLEVSGQ